MDPNIYPIPPSHKTFNLSPVTIDSNFDSGNCFNAEKVNNTCYNLWIAVDHQKNQYRTWFHFSLKGLNKGTVVTFNIKNMQGQSKLLNEGLVPVFRQQNSTEWKRIAHKIDLSKIEYNEGWIQWTWKHTMTSSDKVFFAFFYPWSNQDNDKFLKGIEEKCKSNKDIYFKRSTIMKSLEGRPIDYLTISSKKGISNKDQKYQDQHLFSNGGAPKQFISQKRYIVIGARVHPGQLPCSHVCTGIIQQLTEDSQNAKILRDQFVFLIFPIFNPDGVARGHYRVDTNGINLNRCYINPSPKYHPSIYAVKKIIMHYHNKNKYFGFLDLHAHAGRKGMFIYGNSSNQLEKQVQICLFPKILSMNSQNFEYEGSNFTEKNMHCKDKADHVSKEGAGRVALFKSTKNPRCWTLQCNYNMNKFHNIIQDKKKQEDKVQIPNQNQLDSELIINYRYPKTKEPKTFYTIETFRQLGKQICDSFLDLIQMNPQSRIDNPKNHYKSVQNMKMNLAVALLRMAPNRFQTQYKRIYQFLQGSSTTKQCIQRSTKGLYLLLIKKAKIENLNAFIKQNDDSSIVYPKEKRNTSLNPVLKSQIKPQIKIRQKQTASISPVKASQPSQRKLLQNLEVQFMSNSQYVDCKRQYENLEQDKSSDEQIEVESEVVFSNCSRLVPEKKTEVERRQQHNFVKSSLNPINVVHFTDLQKINPKHNDQMISEALKKFRKSLNNNMTKQASDFESLKHFKINKGNIKQLPILPSSRLKPISIIGNSNQIKLLRKGTSAKDSLQIFAE